MSCYSFVLELYILKERFSHVMLFLRVELYILKERFSHVMLFLRVELYILKERFSHVMFIPSCRTVYTKKNASPMSCYSFV